MAELRLRRSPQPTVGHAHALLVLAQIRVSRREIGEQLFGLLERIAGLGLTLRSLTRLEAESDSTGASSARRAASSR